MFPKKPLSSSQLGELKKFDTPTICNAIESFRVRRNTEGFMKSEIKCIVQYDEPIVGYACTAKISALEPATDEQGQLSAFYQKKLFDFKVPSIAVIEDVDPEPIGSFWGGVNDSIHMALGCNGVITNGGVRDLIDAKKFGFRYFAREILVSHVYVHLVKVNCSVNIGGLTIKPGDLLHADSHGVILIPHEIAPKLAEACGEVVAAEDIVIKECQKKAGKRMKIDVDYLQKLLKEMKSRRDRDRS